MKSEESYNNLHEETEISARSRIRELMKSRRVWYIKKDQKRFNQKRTLLVVQGPRLLVPNAGGLGLTHCRGSRPHMLQLRICMSQLKRSCVPQLRPCTAKKIKNFFLIRKYYWIRMCAEEGSRNRIAAVFLRTLWMMTKVITLSLWIHGGLVPGLPTDTKI